MFDVRRVADDEFSKYLDVDASRSRDRERERERELVAPLTRIFRVFCFDKRALEN